jgi:phosphatidylserine/phosphatidylglycerophosphate/cardiolipin synthase-like enzyme
MNATAICNNDIVYLHWHFSSKITDCLGFSVIRHDSPSSKGVPLPAMVGFPSSKPAGDKFKDTNVWPIQKFAWKDLFAKRGGTYWYEVVPMIGKPDNLKPDLSLTMRTNSVTVDSKRGNASVFFNRGIISTQAIAKSLPKGKTGLPNSGVLQKEIQNPNSAIRHRLVGELEDGVLTLLNRAKTDNGKCYCALYELSDKDLIDHLEGLKSKVQIVLSNAGEDTEEGSNDGDSTNHDARKALHELKIDVTDRMFRTGHIGHNKFVVYVKGNQAKAVLCGSTNWTATGLCAQSNNSIIFELPELADDYLKYWNRLKRDTETADEAGKDSAEVAKKLQGPDLRNADKKGNRPHSLTDNEGNPAGDVHVWFSPNTTQKAVPKPKNKKGTTAKVPPSPPDLAEVFALIENAKQGVLFLAFIPGSPSIVTKLKQVYDAKRKKEELFYLRGAATSPDPAGLFQVELYHRSAKSDGAVHAVADAPGAAKTSAKVSSVAGIFATFAEWEAEIYKVGHAVIHDKILVIDPFTDDSVVVTGSHNLGFKASYANDENMVIIRKNRPVAEAYAAHVLDVYEHYRWRWNIQAPIRNEVARLKEEHPKMKAAELWAEAIDNLGPTVIKKTWQHLTPNDSWQDFYVAHRDFLAAEDNFWSSFGGVGLSKGTPADPVRTRARARRAN